MKDIRNVIMIGGCLEQFEVYRDYPEIKVIVLANGNDLKEAREAGLSCFEANSKDVRQCLDIIVKNGLTKNLYAIYSFIEYGLETAAYIGEALGVLCNPMKPVIQTRNKHLMRATLAQECPEISIPFLFPTEKADIAQFLAEHHKIIVKPVDGAGSMGVRTLAAPEDLEQLDENLTNVICEKFVGGKEFSVESDSVNAKHRIIAITEKTITENAPFVELQHIIPARLDEEAQQKIQQTVIQFLNVIQQKYGPAHTEVKLFEGKVYIIESQTRLGGDRIWKLCHMATGYNFIRAFVEQVLLDREYQHQAQNTPSAIYFLAPTPGIVQEIRIPDGFRDQDGVVEINVVKKIGDVVSPLSSSLDRSGFVILTANDYPKLEKLLEAAATITLETSCEPS